VSKLSILSKYLLGVIYFVFGLNGFLNFLPLPPLPSDAAALLGAFVGTGYFFPFVKGTEVIASVMLLTKIASPLALLVLAPITLNIFLFHLYLTPGIENQIMGFVMLAAHLFAAIPYWKFYSPLFKKI